MDGRHSLCCPTLLRSPHSPEPPSLCPLSISRPLPLLRAPPRHDGEGASKGRGAARRPAGRGRRGAGPGGGGYGAAAAAVAAARQGLEVPAARGSGSGRLGLGLWLRLLQRRPPSGALGLPGPPRSAVRTPAERRPGPPPEPAAMAAAPGIPSNLRRLPLLSVLLLPLLGGESRRAAGTGLGERGSPAGKRGHEEVALGSWAGRDTLEWWRGWRQARSPGARGGEAPADSPPWIRAGPSPLALARTRFHPPRSFPCRSGEFARELPGVAGSRAPLGSFFSGGKRLCSYFRGARCGGWWGDGVPPAVSA